MENQQDPIASIAQQLQTKSYVKQEAYRQLCKAFLNLQDEASKVIDQVNTKLESKDEDISMQVISISDQEFHIKVAGELLIFIMHTNIITLDDEHRLNKSQYVHEAPHRRYLGQINVYNFMSDSLKFNRLGDPGYLLSRFFINCEAHFLVEGERQLNFMFENVSNTPVSPTDLSIFIQILISQALESDLISPPFPTIRTISLNQKIEKTQALGGGQKVGFQMSYQQDTES